MPRGHLGGTVSYEVLHLFGDGHAAEDVETSEEPGPYHFADGRHSAEPVLQIHRYDPHLGAEVEDVPMALPEYPHGIRLVVIVRIYVPSQELEEGGLTGTVQTYYRHVLVLAYGQIYPVQYPDSVTNDRNIG